MSRPARRRRTSPARQPAPGSPPARVRSQLSRPCQERGRRRDAAPASCACGQLLQLTGYDLIGPNRRVGSVPRSPIWIDVLISRLGERAMHLLSVLHARRAIRHGAHQRMTETHQCAELDQPGRLGRSR